MSETPCFLCGGRSVGTLVTQARKDAPDGPVMDELRLRYCDLHSRQEIEDAAEKLLTLPDDYQQGRAEWHRGPVTGDVPRTLN